MREKLSAMAADTFIDQIQRDDSTTILYGMSYIQFAQNEKELFRFLFMRQNAFEEMRTTLAPIMDNSISKIMKKYHISYDEAHYFHDQLSVHAHGIASMIATGFCNWNMDKVEKILTKNEQYLSRKYEAHDVYQ